MKIQVSPSATAIKPTISLGPRTSICLPTNGNPRLAVSVPTM